MLYLQMGIRMIAPNVKCSKLSRHIPRVKALRICKQQSTAARKVSELSSRNSMNLILGV